MKNIKAGKIFLAVVGIMLIGVGVAFNAGTLFGNDPIGIIYDGVRNAANLAPEQLGQVSNFVNFALIAILFFIGRRYIHIGTVVYILPYGTFVSLGTYLYETFFRQDVFFSRLIAAVLGCSFVFIGVGIYIAMDIGLDPFTGIVMVINDKLGWEYRKTKICFDVVMVVIGVLLGGGLGVITIVMALIAGPCIQRVAEFVKTRMQ